MQGDLETHHGLCARLAQRAGIMVVAIDYRLAPEHKFPAAVDDCFAAYAWLRAHGRELGADSGRVGWRATPPAATSPRWSRSSRGRGACPSPRARCSSIPATDFSMETPSHRDLEDGHIIPRERILWYAQQYLRAAADKTDFRASPIRGDLRGQPPALIVTAGFDPLRDEGHAYAEALRKAGADVVYREYPGQIHAFVSLTKAIPQGMACTLEIGDYLRRRLGRG